MKLEELEERIRKAHEKFGDDIFEWLKRMVETEEKLLKESKGEWHDWEWHDVSVRPHVLRELVFLGIIRVAYKSSSHTCYVLVDREKTKHILNKIEEYKQAESEELVKPKQVETKEPEDLFSIISGFDDIKFIFCKALKSERPVHILLVGPPACAKTLFLLEVARLEGAYYVLGGSTTKSGLIDALFNLKPKYLLIDEIDKMSTEDYTALLSLMETGIVKETKYGKSREIKLKTWVFAAANRINRVPPEVVSRFMVFNIPPYSDEQLERVITDVIVKREGKDLSLAREIAGSVIYKLRSKDVRDAIKLSRLCETTDEVEKIVKIWKRYRRVAL